MIEDRSLKTILAKFKLVFKELKLSVVWNYRKKIEKALQESEDRYRYLFEHNPQPMWIYDTETLRFLEVNNAAQHQYGYTRSEFLQMTLLDIRPKEDHQLLIRDVERINSEFDVSGEWRHITKNGKTIHVEINSHAISFGAKKARLVVSANITSRKIAEKKLNTLSLAVEQNPASIIITDSRGKIEYVNAKFSSFMQYSLNEVKGKTPRIFNPGHTSIEEYEKMWQVLRSGKIWQGEYKNRKKDRSEFWENVLISPLVEENGNLGNYVLIMEDITEKKKILDQLIIAKEKAEESDRLKTAFLQNMSHEIRTPMNAIMGFSDLLTGNNVLPEKYRKYAGIINQRSAYLLEIISDILEFSRIESGQLPLHISECNLNNVLTEFETVIQELRIRTDKLNIAFEINRPTLDKNIFIDEIKLKQILINLTSNAFKFTHKGKVVVGCRLLNENCLQFSVSDTGIGIPFDKTKQVFERFKQANSEISKNYGGTGLGLSIVKGLLDLLGGEIWLTTEQEEGTTFYFTMPFRS